MKNFDNLINQQFILNKTRQKYQIPHRNDDFERKNYDYPQNLQENNYPKNRENNNNIMPINNNSNIIPINNNGNNDRNYNNNQQNFNQPNPYNTFPNFPMNYPMLFLAY